MNFKNLLLFIIIIVITSACKESKLLPFNKVGLSILEKYKLKRADLFIKRGRVEFQVRSFEIRNEKIYLLRSGNNISANFKNKFYNSNYVKFISDGTININFKYRGNVSRHYSGLIEISTHEDYIRFVNTTDVEDYVQGAAISEIGFFLSQKISGKWEKELLLAMKTAIRSYIFHFNDRHQGEDYQFCDLTHCVHFKGIVFPNQKNKKLYPVMLDQKDDFLSAYFHSTSGGSLTGPEVFWNNHKPYKNFRRGKDKLYFWSEHLSRKSPHYQWETFVHSSEMSSVLKTNGVRNFEAEYKQGRVFYLVYEDSNKNKKRISISKFMSEAGRKLGWNKIKSNDFRITESSNGWFFKGKGLGHGVGMCQWGGKEMALKGYSYKGILNFYYNNPKIVEGIYK